MPLTTLEWFGTATFRIRHAGLDLFFDAYLDRLPGLEPVGLSTAEVDKADYVFVSHAHFDHLYGADAIALRTGATVVASPESARCLRARGVPDAQLLVVTGETVHCGPSTRVRVLPALHSCLFAHSDADTSVPCLGDLDVSAQDRAATVSSLFSAMGAAPPPAGPALLAMNDACSRHDGGPLAFLLQTTGGSVLVSGSAGYWRGIFEGLRPTSPCCPSADGPTSTANPSRAPRSTPCSNRCDGCARGGSPSATTTPSSPACRGWTSRPAAAALRAPGAPTGYFEPRVRGAGPAPGPTARDRIRPSGRSAQTERAPPDLHQDGDGDGDLDLGGLAVDVEQVAVDEHRQGPDRLGRIRAFGHTAAISTSRCATPGSMRLSSTARHASCTSGPAPPASENACISRPWSR